MTADDICPCRSGRAFRACCEPFLTGAVQAPTAEALMRSRYTAFCKGNADYLFETHHPASRSETERADLQRSIAGTDWVNLTIITTRKGTPRDAGGVVEFVAAYRAKSVALMGAPREIAQMHERSRFVRENGRWFYVDGDPLPPLQQKRNAPCWCGSGAKSKDCHTTGG